MNRMAKILCILLVLLLAALPVAAQDVQSISAGVPLTVELTSSVLEFVYSAPGPQTVTINARSVNSDVDTFLELYDSSGTLMVSNDDALHPAAGASALDATLEAVSLPAAGEYHIKLSNFTGTTGGQIELLLTAQGSAPPVIVPVTGKQLLLGEPLRIRMLGDAPVDLVYVAPQPQSISLYANSLPEVGNVDTTLEVFSPNGVSLAFNDDLRGGDAGFENLVLPEAGAYRVQLNTFSSGATGGVELVLLVGNAPPQPTPVVNGNFGFDTMATLDGTTPAAFTFNGSSGQRVTISAQAVNPVDLDVYIILFAPDGSKIANDDDSGGTLGLSSTDSAIVSLSLPTNGQYRIEVQAWFSGAGDVRVILTPG